MTTIAKEKSPVASRHDRSRLPTIAELRILQVLWRLGPSTVREVHEVLLSGGPIVYTTTLKHLQLMLIKKLVSRNDTTYTHIYVAVPSQGTIQSALLNDLIERVFHGSVNDLLRCVQKHVAERAEIKGDELYCPD